MLLLSVIKIFLYILLFKGGKADNGLDYRALACFGLVVTNIINILMLVTSGSSFILLPVILTFWWLILGLILLVRK